MNRHARWTFHAAACVAVLWPPCATHAQGPAPRALGPVVASTGPIFTLVSFTRVLSDGRVLALDSRERVVLMFDSRLKNPRIVIDSVAGKRNSYGAANGASVLVAMPGDSTMFFDRGSTSFIVLDPTGDVARVQAAPPGFTPPSLENGTPVVSPGLGLVYRASIAGAPPPPAPGAPREMVVPGQVAVMGMNLVTRAVDTLAILLTGGSTLYTFNANGQRSQSPVPAAGYYVPDHWAVMSDGSLSVVRGQEYRVEWTANDRLRAQSGRIPYPWKAIADSAKARIVDSNNIRQKARIDSAAAVRAADSAAGHLRTVTNRSGIATVVPYSLPPSYIDASMLPDFYPALARTTSGRVVAADGDNNLWVLTNHPASTASSPVYDVINRRGELIDRVRIPEGRTLLGFGPGGSVLLMAVDGGKRIIEKARFK